MSLKGIIKAGERYIRHFGKNEDSGKLLTRRFDGASQGRRGFGMPRFGRVNSEVALAGQTLASRATGLYHNNPLIRNAVDNWVAALIGAGIEPVGNAEAVAAWNAWADTADITGRTDVRGIMSSVALDIVLRGEAFLRIIETDNGPQVQQIPPELIDWNKTVDLGNGRQITNGIETDEFNRVLAFWVQPARLNDMFATSADSIREPASEILHIFKPVAAGQVRGISWLAPIILAANELDQLIDANLVSAKIGAMFAGIIQNQNAVGGDDPFDGESVPTLEPGSMLKLNGGWSVTFGQGQGPKEIQPLLKHGTRQLAAGLGMPPHLLDGDLSEANYSSLRAGLLPFRAKVEQVQYHCIIPQMLNPLWKRVISAAASGGEFPNYEENAREYLKVEWLPPAWQQVDPLKAVQADTAELEAGLTSRRKLVAARGWSLEDLDAELQAEGWAKSEEKKSAETKPDEKESEE